MCTHIRHQIDHQFVLEVLNGLEPGQIMSSFPGPCHALLSNRLPVLEAAVDIIGMAWRGALNQFRDAVGQGSCTFDRTISPLARLGVIFVG